MLGIAGLRRIAGKHDASASEGIAPVRLPHVRLPEPPDLYLGLLKPEGHVHLAIHRDRRPEVFLCDAQLPADVLLMVNILVMCIRGSIMYQPRKRPPKHGEDVIG